MINWELKQGCGREKHSTDDAIEPELIISVTESWIDAQAINVSITSILAKSHKNRGAEMEKWKIPLFLQSNTCTYINFFHDINTNVLLRNKIT